jgi:hypothetical protein
MRVRIHDLSLRGCLLEAPCGSVVGQRLTLRLGLPGSDWFSLQGETIRLTAPSKFAVQFLEMDQAREHRLQRVIEYLALSRAARTTMVGSADLSPENHVKRAH